MTGTTITPYLNFGGRCDEALEYYRQALGAEVEFLMRFDESPEQGPPGMIPPGFESKVMHCSFRVGGAPLMATDGLSPDARMDGIRLALAIPDEAAVRRAFEALADGGKIEMPLARTFWSPCFGMLTDRFGVEWMVSVPQAPENG